jgi:hypothetical protein
VSSLSPLSACGKLTSLNMTRGCHYVTSVKPLQACGKLVQLTTEYPGDSHGYPDDHYLSGLPALKAALPWLHIADGNNSRGYDGYVGDDMQEPHD